MNTGQSLTGTQAPSGSGPRRSSLQTLLQSILDLLDSASDHGADLDPRTRRAVHDLAVRVQDRVMVLLADLVHDMANDGLELVDQRGVPTVMGVNAPAETSGEAACADHSAGEAPKR